VFNAGAPGAPDGSFSFDPAGAFDDLAVGQSRIVSFTYEVTDTDGDTGQATVEITVTGTNDAPTLAAGAGAAVEDGVAITVDLAALGDDIDADDDGTTLIYSMTGAPCEGTASISGTSLSFDPGADFQDLAAGETRDVTIQVTATDAHGATAVNDVTITVTGTNDAPLASLDDTATDAVVESGVNPFNTPFAGDDSATGNVLGNDTNVDTSDLLQISTVNGLLTNVGAIVLGTFGSVNIGSDGSYTYTLYNADPDTQALAQGELASDVFTYQVSDGNGGTDTATLTIAITGTNDEPTVGTGTVGAVEYGPPVIFDLTSIANDVESDDNPTTLTYAIPGGPSEGSAIIMGTNLKYSPGSDFQDLAVGETRDIIVNISATDSHGAVSTGSVTVTVTGTNDAPNQPTPTDDDHTPQRYICSTPFALFHGSPWVLIEQREASFRSLCDIPLPEHESPKFRTKQKEATMTIHHDIHERIQPGSNSTAEGLDELRDTKGISGIGRRATLMGLALGSVAMVLRPIQAAAAVILRRGDTPHKYEIVRTEDEWKSLLNEAEYKVLRKGITEFPNKEAAIWKESRDGIYACRGCDLSSYEARSRVPVDTGFVFFVHSVPDSVLTSVDGPQKAYGQSESDLITMIEVHCRRCSSHLGHILLIKGEMLHCINGTALNFYPNPAA
jgi:VCBS repeat-containing protein